ncbi:MAG: hypothetical protein JSS93_07485 [Bacteroidetes bacterium]|nr:hypothetical protein [Bacteroidota bacterium]
MTHPRQVILLALMAITSGSISCQTSAAVKNKIDINKIIERELGTLTTVSYNEPHTLVLAYTENNRVLTYLVLRPADGKLILKDKAHASAVSWSGEHQIKLNIIPGMVKRDATPEDNYKYVNLDSFIK